MIVGQLRSVQKTLDVIQTSSLQSISLLEGEKGRKKHEDRSQNLAITLKFHLL